MQVLYATPVVGICSRHFEDRCDKKLIMYLPDPAKIHSFILNIGPGLKYLLKGSLYLFMLSVLYAAAVLAREGAKSPRSDCFF